VTNAAMAAFLVAVAMRNTAALGMTAAVKQ
jgi:hypothetical protein